MDADETKSLPNRPISTTTAEQPARRKTENEPFSFGDSTILQLRNQDFEPADEFGTVVLKPGQALDTEPAGIEAPAAAAQSEDPLVRIEQKLDAALRQLHSLQQRLESLDATIAKVLMR
jgi:hypothetical protein